MVCDRCKQREALHTQMVVFDIKGAFCAVCLAEITRAFYEQHPEIMAQMAPGLTVEQLIEGQLRIGQAMLDVSDPSDTDELIRRLKGMSE